MVTELPFRALLFGEKGGEGTARGNPPERKAEEALTHLHSWPEGQSCSPVGEGWRADCSPPGGNPQTELGRRLSERAERRKCRRTVGAQRR